MADGERPKCPSCDLVSARDWRCDRCGALIRTGDLRVEQLLSFTPHGRVYRGRLGDQPVAVKELVFASAPAAETVERFEQEAEQLSRLDHPALPRTIRAFHEGEGDDLRLYVIWQLVDGESLEDRIEGHRYEEPEARKIAADVLEALGYLHSRQPRVLHRELKPSNIIRRPDGGHSLVDLGFSSPDLEEEPAINAAYGYRAPEQVIGDPDERSDLYALGMSLARLLSRRDVSDLYGTDLTVVFRPYVNASPAFLDFIDGLVARSREGRFSSAVRALKALRGLAGGGGDRALGASGPVPSTRLVPAEIFQFKMHKAKEPSSGPYLPAGTRLVWVQSSRVPSDATPSGRPWCAELGNRRLGLRPGFAYLVGRGDDADVRVEDDWLGADTVSRRHVTLTVNRFGLMVREMGSVNGTVVGQMPLPKGSGTIQVKDPTKLRLGRFEIRVYPWKGGDEA